MERSTPELATIIKRGRLRLLVHNVIAWRASPPSNPRQLEFQTQHHLSGTDDVGVQAELSKVALTVAVQEQRRFCEIVAMIT